MTPSEGHAFSPASFQEPIQTGGNADGKEGVRESSGPETRETLPGSPSVLTSLHLSRVYRRTKVGDSGPAPRARSLPHTYPSTAVECGLYFTCKVK
jgi:hypothetical protein